MTTFQLAICAAVGAIVALLLLCIGWTGKRINQHPFCRKCGYEVSGISSDGACPECGTDLGSRRGIKVGKRKKRWWVVALGAFLFAASVRPAYLASTQTLQNGWWSLAPTWMVSKLLFSSDPSWSDAAMGEFAARHIAGKLDSREKHRVIDRVMALAHDGKPLTNGNHFLILVQSAIDGDIKPVVVANYFEKAVDFTLTSTPAAPIGLNERFEILLNGVNLPPSFRTFVAGKQTTLYPAQPWRMPGRIIASSTSIGASRNSSSLSVEPKSPKQTIFSGVQLRSPVDVQVDITVEVQLSWLSSGMNFVQTGVRKEWSKSRSFAVEKGEIVNVAVVPPTSTQSAVTSPMICRPLSCFAWEDTPANRSFVPVDSVSERPLIKGPHLLDAKWLLETKDLAIVHEVVVIYKGTEHRTNALIAMRPQTALEHFARFSCPAEPGEPIDIELRPCPELMKQPTKQFQKVTGEVICFKDVIVPPQNNNSIATIPSTPCK